MQIDGSDHHWFEERAPACTLLVYVDDATSRLMHLHFTASESTFSYFEATRAYIECHGKPGAFYSDKASVFRSGKAHETGSSVTHFGRAMFELNIDTFCANSSSAKGRVERAHLTLQDRATERVQGTKEQREFTQDDINDVITELSQRRQPKQTRKPGRRSAGSA